MTTLYDALMGSPAAMAAAICLPRSVMENTKPQLLRFEIVKNRSPRGTTHTLVVTPLPPPSLGPDDLEWWWQQLPGVD